MTADPATFLALADRIEREEPSEELREAILVAWGWEKMNTRSPWWMSPHRIEHRDQDAPDPLHSIDDAASLMPGGWMRGSYQDDVRCWVAEAREPGTIILIRATSSTEASARAALACRVRARMVEGHRMPDEDWMEDMRRRVGDAIFSMQKARRCEATARPCSSDCACLRLVEDEIAKLKAGAP